MADKTRIIDGDTYIDERGRRVRLAGVDTPENTPRAGYEPGGFEATRLAQYELGRGFDVAPTGEQSYGRTVGGVTTPGGEDFGQQLLRNNLGDTTSWSDDNQRQAQIQGTLGDLFKQRTPGTPDYPEALRDSAARERAAAFQRLASGQFDDRILAGGQRDYSGADLGGRSGRALSRGTANLRGQWYGLSNALGQVLGADALEQYGRDGMEAAMRDALRNPADIGSLDNVDSLADFAVWASEAFLEEFPGLALDLGAAAAGYITGGGSVAAAGAGKALLRNLGGAKAAGLSTELMSKGAQLGLRTGAAASMYMQQTGGAQMDMVGHGIEDRGDRALWLGGINTAVNYTAFMSILGDVSRRFNAGEAVDALGQSFGSALRTIGGQSLGAMVHGTGQEGVAGLVETLVLELNKANLDPSYEVNPMNLLEGLATGGVVGGAMGGVGGAAGGTYQVMGGADAAAGSTEPPASGEGQDEGVERLRRRSWNERAETTAEPPMDLAASIGERPTGFVHVSAENVRDGVTLAYLQSQYPDLQMRELSDGSVQVAQTEAGLASAPENPTEADQAAALDYVQPKDEVMAAAAAGQPATVVSERDVDGHVVRDQVVTEARAAEAELAAAEQGHTTERLAPEQAQAERRRRYEEQLAQITGVEVADRSAAPTQMGGERPLPPGAFEFTDERAPADIAPLVEEAAALGIDPAPYQRTEPMVDEAVLRRELASRLNEAMPDNPDITLRESLGGRHLSDLEAGQLRQLARAMGMRDLPQPLRAVQGNRQRFRQIAQSAVARKLNEWRRGTRQDTDGTWLGARSPSDMSLLSVLVPELKGLSRRNFGKGEEGTAEYQAAVRRALEQADAAGIRQRLAEMDDAQLWQAAQLTRAERDVTENRDGFTLELGEEPRVDVGALSRAVAERRQTGEAGSRNTREEADARVADAVLGVDLGALEEAGTPVDPFLLQDAGQAAAAAAAYAHLSGETTGPGLRQVLASQRGVLTDEELTGIRPTALDGGRLMRSVVAGEVRDDQAEARMRDWQALAIDSPTQFAQEFSTSLSQLGVPLDAYIAGSIDTSGKPAVPTAQGTASRSSPGSQEPGAIGGMDYSTLEGRPEQEKSDGLFFIGLLDGARFGVDAEGNTQPAGAVEAASDSPMHRQRVTSIERTERLDGANLAALTVRNRQGVEEAWQFDLVALAQFGQPGQGAVKSAGDAFFNLLANLSRMTEGSATLAHQPDGQNASYVQALRSDAATRIPGNTVIFEQDGETVTFAEAERRYFQGLAERNEASDLANRADELRGLQRNRRGAIRLLLARAANSLGSLEGDARRERLKAINDAMYQALDGDQLLDNVRLVTRQLTESEQAEWRAMAEQGLAHLRGEEPKLVEAVAVAEAEVGAAKREVASLTSPVLKEIVSARYVGARRESPVLSTRQLREVPTIRHKDAEVAANSTRRPEPVKVKPDSRLDLPDSASLSLEVELANTALVQAQERHRWLQTQLGRARRRMEGIEESLAGLPPTEAMPEGVDLRDVRAGSLARFALTDREAAAVGDTGGHLNLETLRAAYRSTRGELRTITDTLQRRPRTTPDTDPQVDTMAREFMAEGMLYDEAYELAESLHERTDGVTGREAETDGVSLEAPDGPLVDEDGNPLDAYLDASGEVTPAPIYNDANEADAEMATPDESAMDAEQREAYRRAKQRDEEHEAKVAAFKAANADNPEVNMADPAPEPRTSVYESFTLPPALHGVQRARFAPGSAASVPMRGLRSEPAASPAHSNALQRMQDARRAQASGIPLPQNDRAGVLDRVFRGKGMRVVGAFDSEAVGSFVGQALRDFRSTDRPVLVMVGESAQQIAEFINRNALLPPNKRKLATRKLIEAQAGNRPLYMPMGDFVLVSMPAQPNTARQKTNLKWYHALGHELGHLVFDDYAAALDRNRALRTQVHTAFEAATELKPHQDEGLYKEWFANQAANEMLAQAFGQADPQRVTPFTRLANLMQGLWERIQHLVPDMTRSRSFAAFAEAIRDGQIRRNRDAATADFDVEFYGGNAMEGARLKRSADKLGAAVKRVTAEGSVLKSSANLVRTVIGRLEAYSPEFASRFYQRSAADRGKKGVAAWQQHVNAARGRYTGAMQRTFRAIEAGAKGKKAREAAIEQAFRDLEAGRQTQGAQLLATFIDGVITDAEKNGLRSVIHRDDFVPVAMNHKAVDSRRQEFTALLREAFPDENDAALRQRLEVLLDGNGFSQYSIAPGVPVSLHDTSNRLIDTVGTERLREAGFLNERSDAVLYHWLEGVAARTAWEANFGGYTRDVASPAAENERLLGRADPQGQLARDMHLVNEEGLYWDPNGEYHKLMEGIVAEHGIQAKADIESMLDGVLGRKTSQMPRGIRQINDWVTAWTGWTVLLFSGIASIPEVGLPAVRAHGRVGILDGLRGFPEAWRMAKDMGVVMSDSAERIIWQTMGDNYESSTLNKMGNAFFKWNGQKLMTDVNRAMGVSFGQRYLIKSAEIGDHQALAQLGVTEAEVRAWDSAGRPSWQPGINTANNAVAEKVQAAINQFVYEGSSMPSKFQNPSWFNNPYLKVFWMIKRYMYAYGEGILMGMWRQGKRQWTRGQGLAAEQRAFLAVAPVLMFGIATMPLAYAGVELREWMRPYTTGRRGKDVEDYGGPRKYAEYLFSRTGGYGPLEAILSARQQSEWGYSPIGSVSPVAAKAEMWFDWGQDGQMSQQEFLTKMRQSIPVFSQMPRAWNAAVDAIAN